MAKPQQRPKLQRSSTWLSWFDAKSPLWEATAGGWPTAVWFGVIVAAAFAVRVIVLIQLSSSHPSFSDPIVDSRWHYLWAKEIAKGDWLGRDVFYRAPLYPYLLGLWIKVFGDGLWPIRLMQAFIGGITAGLTFLIGVRAFGRRVGIIAGLAIAIYGTLVYYETELLIEVVAVPLGLWAIWLAMKESSQPSPRLLRWLGVGIVVGLFAIARPNILLVVPAFWWWAWPTQVTTTSGGLIRKLRAPLLVTCGLLIPILPVTARNYVVANDPVLISYQGGVNLWLGNNPRADGLTMQMPEVVLDESVEWDEFVHTTDSVASALAGRELHASEVSSFWSQRALDWMIENPGAAIGGWWKKTLYFLGGYEVSDQTDIYAYSGYSPLLNPLISRPLVYVPFGLIVPFGLLGLVLAWRQSKQTRPLVAFVALYAVTVILFLATARHRLPIVPIFVVCAVAAVVHFARVMGRKQIKPVVFPALLAIGPMVWLNQRTAERIMFNPAFVHYQTALAHERKSDFDLAIEEYEEALEAEPNHLASRKNLAYALVRMGMYDSAVAVSFSYLRHRQTDAEAYNNIGLAYLGRGDTALAEGSFRVASRNNKKLPHPYLNLGDIAAARNDIPTALGYYGQALRADSTFGPAYSAMAITLVNTANYIEAERTLRTGLRHFPDHAVMQANLGALYLKLDRATEAIPLLERSIYLQPQATGVRLNLALAYIKQENLEAATEQLRRVLADDPTNETAKVLLEQLSKLPESS